MVVLEYKKIEKSIIKEINFIKNFLKVYLQYVIGTDYKEDTLLDSTTINYLKTKTHPVNNFLTLCNLEIEISNKDFDEIEYTKIKNKVRNTYIFWLAKRITNKLGDSIREEIGKYAGLTLEATLLEYGVAPLYHYVAVADLLDMFISIFSLDDFYKFINTEIQIIINTSKNEDMYTEIRKDLDKQLVDMNLVYVDYISNLPYKSAIENYYLEITLDNKKSTLISKEYPQVDTWLKNFLSKDARLKENLDTLYYSCIRDYRLAAEEKITLNRSAFTWLEQINNNFQKLFFIRDFSNSSITKGYFLNLFKNYLIIPKYYLLHYAKNNEDYVYQNINYLVQHLFECTTIDLYKQAPELQDVLKNKKWFDFNMYSYTNYYKLKFSIVDTIVKEKYLDCVYISLYKVLLKYHLWQYIRVKDIKNVLLDVRDFVMAFDTYIQNQKQIDPNLEQTTINSNFDYQEILFEIEEYAKFFNIDLGT